MSSAVANCLCELTHPYQGMDKLLGFYILILFLKPSEASPLSNCRDGLEYTNGVCCSKCPAGKRQASPCTGPGEAGTCEECDDGTFTEHANVLNQCLKCTRCRSDQEVVRPCTHTQDGECHCKAGRFCAPDQACEVCKKCSRCKEDEALVRNCTSTSNTECKKRQLEPTSASGNAWVVVLPILAVGLLAGMLFVLCKCRRERDSQMNPHNGWKAGNPDSDDCADDDANDRSNGDTQRLSCLNVAMPWHLEEEEEEEVFPKLVAVNGEESLRKCFEYFEDVDFDLHKKFFRHLNVSDNVIKSKDHLPYDDKIHDLLTIWVEKEGRGATLNDLLTALLNLQQKQTAETIKKKALLHGHYNVEA